MSTNPPSTPQPATLNLAAWHDCHGLPRLATTGDRWGSHLNLQHLGTNERSNHSFSKPEAKARGQTTTWLSFQTRFEFDSQRALNQMLFVSAFSVAFLGVLKRTNTDQIFTSSMISADQIP